MEEEERHQRPAADPEPHEPGEPGEMPEDKGEHEPALETKPALPWKQQSTAEESPSIATDSPASQPGNPFEQKRVRTLRRRLVIGSVLGGVAVFVVAWLIILANRGGILILEPDDNFTVTLNGEPATLRKEGDGVLIRTRPGVYRLRLTRTDYDPYTTDITVKRGQVVRLRPVFSILPAQAVTQDGTVAFVRPSADGQAVYYYATSTGIIYRLELKDQVQVPITDTPLSDVKDIQWSGDQNVALVTMNDGLYLQEIPILNFENQVRVKIAGTEASSAVWDPTNSERLAFAYSPGTGERSLAIADKRIIAIEHKADISLIPSPKLVWSPDANYIALVGQSSDATKNDVWVYKTVDGSLTQVTTSGHVLNATFSPDSGTLVYELSTNDPANPVGSVLKTVKPDGHVATALDVPGTVANVAWKDAGHFFFPDPTHSDLITYGLDGSSQTVPFSFPNEAVKGMSYFPASQTLIFTTQHSIYLSDLAK